MTIIKNNKLNQRYETYFISLIFYIAELITVDCN